MSEPVLGLFHRRSVSGRNPPQREDGLVAMLKPLLALPHQVGVARAVDVGLEVIE